MKRFESGVVGRPLSSKARRDVAGLRSAAAPREHASFHLQRAADEARERGGDVMADFAEFIRSDDAVLGGESCEADPAFRERLRRRLWRTRALTRLGARGPLH